MGLFGNISGKEAVKVFQKIGYYIDHQQGSHFILYHGEPGYPPLCIPNHRQLAPGLLIAQIKRARLSVEQFQVLRKRRKGY